MKIDRWSAEIIPTELLIKSLFISEGLDPQLIFLTSGARASHCRTHMNEVIQIVTGEVIFNLSGTQFNLKAGDRLEMAANTQYSYNNFKSDPCCFFSGLRV